MVRSFEAVLKLGYILEWESASTLGALNFPHARFGILCPAEFHSVPLSRAAEIPSGE